MGFDFSTSLKNTVSLGKTTTAKASASFNANLTKNVNVSVGAAVNQIVPTQLPNPAQLKASILGAVPQNPLSGALSSLAGVSLIGKGTFNAKAIISKQLSIVASQVLSALILCLQNALRSLLNKALGKIKLPNFGKINSLLKFEIKIAAELNKLRAKFDAKINGFLKKLHLNKLKNYNLQLMGLYINKEIAKLCNQITPKQKKEISSNPLKLVAFAKLSTDKLVAGFAAKFIEQKKGTITVSAKDFFDAKTGINLGTADFKKLVNPLNQVSSQLNTSIQSINATVSITPPSRFLKI